jgi:hypothetical protein
MISRKRHNKPNQGVIDTNILYEPIEIRDIFYIGFGGIQNAIGPIMRFLPTEINEN